ncbi:unnamed protein product [Prorocentrum cordatum]|uniref:Uncharacterized protein n=1 Tax=Prorocentrum cordatum TaxID=2364126 RepID=A0ABN9WLU3_9DINO|nr:unnamed protein product [Polarella glacialis]
MASPLALDTSLSGLPASQHSRMQVVAEVARGDAPCGSADRCKGDLARFEEKIGRRQERRDAGDASPWRLASTTALDLLHGGGCKSWNSKMGDRCQRKTAERSRSTHFGADAVRRTAERTPAALARGKNRCVWRDTGKARSRGSGAPPMAGTPHA